MRKGTLFLATLIAVGLATAADAATKRKAAPKDSGLAAQEQSNTFIRDSFQPWTTQLAPASAPRAARKGKAKKKG
jgi:hypothetical protein